MNHYSYNIIGIDPGGHTGLSIMSIDDEFNILSITPLTLNLDDYTHNEKGLSKSVDRLVALDGLITDILTTYDPIAIGMEVAFVNNRFPMSGLSLAKYTAILDVAIRKYVPESIVFRLAPKLIKSAVGAGGKAVKDDMYENLLSIQEVSNFILDNPSCDEHNVDATAIAYVVLDSIRKDNSVLFTMRE